MPKKEEVTVIIKKNCLKCEEAKKLAEKLKEQYSIKFLPVETIDGLAEFALSGFTYPPVIIFKEKRWNSVLLAEKELLGVSDQSQDAY